jgi:hypothetical protein
MWQHVEPEKLLEAAEGAALQEMETAHMTWCEFCQELLLFFVSHRPLLKAAKPDVKAA